MNKKLRESPNNTLPKKPASKQIPRRKKAN